MEEELPEEQQYATCHSGSPELHDVSKTLQAIRTSAGGGGSADNGMADEWNSAITAAPSIDSPYGPDLGPDNG